MTISRPEVTIGRPKMTIGRSRMTIGRPGVLGKPARGPWWPAKGP